MFSNPFEQLKLHAHSELPEVPFKVHFGVISIKLHICHSNLATHRTCLELYQSALICSCIHIAHCTYAMCWMFFSSSFVLFSPVERDSEEKIDSSWRVLDPNGQVKNLFLKQYSGFLKPGKHNLLSAHLWFKVIWSSYDACGSKYFG